MNRTVVLYHRGCPDGWSSAYMMQRAIDPDALLVPMDWHAEPPVEECRGAAVWSVDYLPDAQWIDAIAGVCDIFTALDHHQSSLKEVEALGSSYGRPYYFTSDLGAFIDMSDLGALDNVSIVIDQSRSGAGLTAAVTRHLTGILAPWHARFTEDRDLWRFDLTDTADVVAALASYPMTVEAWDQVTDREPHEVMAEGRAINRFRQQLVEQCAVSSVRLPIGEFEVQCAVSPYAIGSDVAGLLAEQSPDGIGGYIILHEKHVQFGLRSRGDGPDVAKIAESYGGGGHRNASGFTADYADFGFMAHFVYA